MVTNYYTLNHIADDLHQRLNGCRLLEAFSQNRNELVLLFQGDLDEADRPRVVLISCEPSANFIVQRDSFARARRNSIDFFLSIIGELLTSVILSPADREIIFRFSSGRELVAQFFGSRANVLLCDNRRIVLEPFLKAIAPESHLPESRPPQQIAHASELMQHLRALPQDISFAAAAKRLFPRYGATLIRELFTRTDLISELMISELSERDAEAFAAAAIHIHEELLRHAQPRIYFRDSAPVEFSLIPLQQFHDLRVQLFDDVHSAIRSFLGSAHVLRGFREQQRTVLHALQQEQAKTDRTIQKIESESPVPEDVAEKERFGKLVTAHLHELRKGMPEAILEDVYSEGSEPVIVPLDVHLTPAKNAERYFERAKKLRETIAEQHDRKIALHIRREEINAALRELDEVSTHDELRVFIEQHAALLALAGYRSSAGKSAAPPPPPFRVFVVTGGFHVWAGKSGENNDLLTTRHTGKDDLWFHARGVGGSHVVLKVHTGKGEVGKASIRDAAAIAAYYSKMKNASLVPVTMCLGKYVRKPKGAPAGTVMVEREETIFAEPGLPETK